MKRILIDVRATGHEMSRIAVYPGWVTADHVHRTLKAVQELIHKYHGRVGAAEFRCRDKIELDHWNLVFGANEDASRFVALVETFPLLAPGDVDHLVLVSAGVGNGYYVGFPPACCAFRNYVGHDVMAKVCADPANYVVATID